MLKATDWCPLVYLKPSFIDLKDGILPSIMKF